MKDEFKFNSLEDLYRRVKPALFSKKEELRREGKNYIKEEDIWNYLSENVWSKKENLSLSELVNDILYIDKTMLNEYVLNILRRENREIKSSEEGDLL